MLEAQIPKDVRSYETKFLGPFTVRQLVCLVIGVVIAFVVYELFKDSVNTTTLITICMLFAAPVIPFGWMKPYDLPFEKFLEAIMFTMFLTPTKRKYKTVNSFTPMSDPLKEMNKKEYEKRVKEDAKRAKKDPEYIAYK